jgi:hypothetical protein
LNDYFFSRHNPAPRCSDSWDRNLLPALSTR